MRARFIAAQLTDMPVMLTIEQSVAGLKLTNVWLIKEIDGKPSIKIDIMDALSNKDLDFLMEQLE